MALLTTGISIFQFLDPLVDYCNKRGIRLYVKLHPLLSMVYDLEKSGGIDWFARIRNLQRSRPNIILLDTNQPFETVKDFFWKSDLFLTDNSGLGFEYVLITGRHFLRQETKSSTRGCCDQ